MKKGIADLSKGPAAPDAEGGAEPDDTSLGAGNEGAGEADPDLIKKLAAEAAKIDPKRYRRGQVRLMWSEEKDDVFEGTVQGRSAAGRAVAGRVKAHIEKRLPGGKLAVKYLSTTPVVDSAGNIVLTAAQLADLNKTLTVIAGGKTKWTTGMRVSRRHQAPDEAGIYDRPRPPPTRCLDPRRTRPRWDVSSVRRFRLRPRTG